MPETLFRVYALVLAFYHPELSLATYTSPLIASSNGPSVSPWRNSNPATHSRDGGRHHDPPTPILHLSSLWNQWHMNNATTPCWQLEMKVGILWNSCSSLSVLTQNRESDYIEVVVFERGIAQFRFSSFKWVSIFARWNFLGWVGFALLTSFLLSQFRKFLSGSIVFF